MGNKGKAITLTISGGPELSQALREVGDFMTPATVRGRVAAGMIKASQPMVEMANQLAVTDNQGADDIVFIASRSVSRRQRRGRKDKNLVQTYVGERAGSTVGLWNEFGTAERVHVDAAGAGQKSVGALPARPALRPAFEATAGAVLSAIVPAVAVELKKATERAHKKQAKALRLSTARNILRDQAQAAMRERFNR